MKSLRSAVKLRRYLAMLGGSACTVCGVDPHGNVAKTGLARRCSVILSQYEKAEWALSRMTRHGYQLVLNKEIDLATNTMAALCRV